MEDSDALRSRNFSQSALRWHAPFLLLIFFLAVYSLSTFGSFVVSDDLIWVQRTVADAHKPWNAFGKPTFGDYYRPVPNLVWMMNYWIWGFDFDGHQFMFILLWLAGVCLVYALGCRLGGRIAGFAAAAIVGLNDMYLLLVSWKSWYTTLIEFVVVLAWALCFLEWLESRKRNYWTACAALAIVGLLSRELAPLIVSAVVLVTVILPAFASRSGGAGKGLPSDVPPRVRGGAKERRRAVGWLILWALLTIAALLILPSYRNGVRALLETARRGMPAAAQTAPSGSGVTFAYVWERFVSHASGIFDYGILRWLVWFAVVFAALRARREAIGRVAAYRQVLLGAFVLGAVLLGIPWGFAVLGKQADVVSILCAQPAAAAILMAVFCAAAFAGDRCDRMLGAWFLVSFVPVLFLEHKSGAYHLLAFTALALYTARKVAVFAGEELRPAIGRLRGRAPRPDDARYILSGLFVLLLLVQAVMLGRDVCLAWPEVQRRVAYGRDMQTHVSGAVESALNNAGSDRRVWVAPQPYAELAGLILREKCGFRVEPLDRSSPAGLRPLDKKVPVYVQSGVR